MIIFLFTVSLRTEGKNGERWHVPIPDLKKTIFVLQEQCYYSKNVYNFGIKHIG